MEELAACRDELARVKSVLYATRSRAKNRHATPDFTHGETYINLLGLGLTKVYYGHGWVQEPYLRSIVCLNSALAVRFVSAACN